MRQRKIAMGFTERRAFTADIAGAARALSADGDADKGDDGGAWGGERDGGSAANSGHSGLQKYASTGGIFAASAPAALRGQGAGKDVSEPYSATRPGTSGSAGDVESLRAYTTGMGGRAGSIFSPLENGKERGGGDLRCSNLEIVK